MRVLIADDQRVVREGLATIVGGFADTEVVGLAADGVEAVTLVGECAPDVVLMDLRMPRMDGVEATGEIRSRHPAVPVVVLTTFADDESVLAALSAGAAGYLTKDAARDDIRRALEAAVAGQTILDARAATPADFSFATVETSAQLPPTPTPPAQAPTAPPGPQIVPADIETALATVIPTRDVILDAPDTALKVNTRRLKDASVFFFFNEGAQPSAHSVTIRADGRKVEAWDPATGTVSTVAATPSKGSVTVKLDLKPYETKLITVQ